LCDCVLQNINKNSLAMSLESSLSLAMGWLDGLRTPSASLESGVAP
jgi:hypothetical protein